MKIKKIIILTASAIVLIAIGIIIGINVELSVKKPVMTDCEGESWTLTPQSEAELIYDNFWQFARASYILIGTPPDCEFYKIASEVPRNDYDSEQFYIDDDSDSMYYHDAAGNRTSRLAIDVSAYQTNIDWEMLRASGVEIAMVRAGYRGYGTGALVTDDMLYSHLQGALDAGIKVGVYFFSQALSYEEGVEEANYVLQIINGYDITYPVVIDTELMSAEDARTAELDNASRTDSIVGFCETIKGAGYTPMIYSNRNWYAQNLDMTRLGAYQLWVAQYVNQPDFPYLYKGWQYTNQGTIAGVDTEVDLNVWFD